MPELTNDFAWSVTRQQTFNACKRRYYYQYYGKWGGWDQHAEADTKQAYRLSKIITLPMLAGQVVHEQIDRILSSWRRDELISLDQATDQAIAHLKRAWCESKQQRWRENPSQFANLFEHYYGLSVSDDDTLAIGRTVREALAGFYQSQAFGGALATPSDQWKTIEKFQGFTLEGTDVKLKMDFARERDGQLVICDWKTGMRNSADPDQLFTYALYAETVWGTSLNDIVLALVFLNRSVEQTFQLDPQHRQAFVGQVLTSSQAMRACLIDPDHNIAAIDDFPVSDNIKICRRCNFQEFCFGGPVDTGVPSDEDTEDWQPD